MDLSNTDNGLALMTSIASSLNKLSLAMDIYYNNDTPSNEIYYQLDNLWFAFGQLEDRMRDAGLLDTKDSIEYD